MLHFQIGFIILNVFKYISEYIMCAYATSKNKKKHKLYSTPNLKINDDDPVYHIHYTVLGVSRGINV